MNTGSKLPSCFFSSPSYYPRKRPPRKRPASTKKTFLPSDPLPEGNDLRFDRSSILFFLIVLQSVRFKITTDLRFGRFKVRCFTKRPITERDAYERLQRNAQKLLLMPRYILFYNLAARTILIKIATSPISNSRTWNVSSSDLSIIELKKRDQLCFFFVFNNKPKAIKQTVLAGASRRLASGFPKNNQFCRVYIG